MREPEPGPGRGSAPDFARSRRVPSSVETNAWARLIEARRASGADLIDLTDANPTRVGLSSLDPEWLAAISGPRAARYEPDPRGSISAREAVASHLRARGADVDSSRVVLTSGTSESYAHLFRLLCDPGERVLAPRPSYPLFEPLAALEGVRLGDYRFEYDHGWRLDRDSLEGAIDERTRAVIVVEPNHPTGSCLDSDERRFLEELCERHRLALVSDEVFADFAWLGRDGTGSMIENARVPTFALGGLSKTCGLPQMKLGWIAVAGPEVARAQALAGLEWIADLFLSVGTPVQLALPALLEQRAPFQRRTRERIAVNLARLDRAVAEHRALERLEAGAGWVAVLRLPRTRSEEDWALELLRRDTIVHPGHFYDFEHEAYAVISLIVEPDRFDTGVGRIEELIREI